jgi:hypothetical protein
MNRREVARYSSKVSPADFCDIVVSWDDSFQIDARIVDCGVRGVEIFIDIGETYETEAPRKGDALKVHIPMEERWLTGRCASVAEKNGYLLITMWFKNPDVQALFTNRFDRSLI